MRDSPQILRLALFSCCWMILVDSGWLREDSGYCLENNCEMDTEPKEDGVSQPAATSVREDQGGEVHSSAGVPPDSEDEWGISKVHFVDSPKHKEELSIKDKVGDTDEDKIQPKETVIVPPEGVSGTSPVGVLATSIERVLETPTGEDHVSKDMEMSENEDSSEDTSEDTSEESDYSQEPFDFPNTLEGFQYKFDDEGRLRHTKTNEAFVFEVKKGCRRYNQAHYEALGEVSCLAPPLENGYDLQLLLDHHKLPSLYQQKAALHFRQHVVAHLKKVLNGEIYRLLETRCKLIKHYLPVDASEDEPRTFFFMSEKALENTEKLLILIHGSGAVRAGQWARSLIINNDLDSGTQLPYIERGLKEGYEIMVLNTNYNYAEAGGKTQPIRGNSTPQKHAMYVWDKFVRQSEVQSIDIIAHSFGGAVAVDLATELVEEFYNRVNSMAFTDSTHTLLGSEVTRRISRWIKKHTVNWISSEDELDTKQRQPYRQDVPRRSAGTLKHVETSWKSLDSVFRYLASRHPMIAYDPNI